MPLGSRDTNAFTSSSSATNIDLQADGYSVLVDLNNASSWDSTVDFQATIDGSNYFNIPYLTLGSLSPAASVAQLSSPSTSRYILPGPWTQVRIAVGSGSTGTLTVVYRVVPSGDVADLTPAGILTYSSGAKATVGSSSGTIVAANTSRKLLASVNDSNDEVFLGIGETAVINEGIRLNAGGGSVVFGGSGLPLTLLAVNGIASGASKNVTVQEGT